MDDYEEVARGPDALVGQTGRLNAAATPLPKAPCVRAGREGRPAAVLLHIIAEEPAARGKRGHHPRSHGRRQVHGLTPYFTLTPTRPWEFFLTLFLFHLLTLHLSFFPFTTAFELAARHDRRADSASPLAWSCAAWRGQVDRSRVQGAAPGRGTQLNGAARGQPPARDRTA